MGKSPAPEAKQPTQSSPAAPSPAKPAAAKDYCAVMAELVPGAQAVLDAVLESIAPGGRMVSI